MHKKLWTSLPLGATSIAAQLLFLTPVIAGEIVGELAQCKEDITPLLDRKHSSASSPKGYLGIGQVTSVSQLSDVQPTDWAFQALRSLVERYGIISGYPDGTFGGNRAMTRYEFAAALNTALDRISELITSGIANQITQADLSVILRLQQEFALELRTLQNQVEALEARTAQLEANQFSTTTTFTGEVIFSLSDALGKDIDVQPVFQSRIRLFLNTSFTGKDLLVIADQSGNANEFDFTGNTGEGLQAIQVFGDSDNENNSALVYTTPLNENLEIGLAGYGLFFAYFAPTLNPYLEDFSGGSGALSFFAQRNPIYALGGGAGVSFHYKLNKSLQFTGVYLASTADSPISEEGLFNGDYAVLAQLTLTPSNRFSLAFTYLNSYFTAGNFAYGDGTDVSLAGTNVANTLNGLRDDFPAIANSYGVQTSWNLSYKFTLSGWVGLTKARLIGYGDAEIWNYAVALKFPDLGSEGNLGTIVLGAEPTLRGLDVPASTSFPRDWAYHIEASYKYQATENISITPGFIWLPAPNQNTNNDDIFIGILRTTFIF